LLRLFVGEQKRYGHQPLYEAIVIKARERGLTGATDTGHDTPLACAI